MRWVVGDIRRTDFEQLGIENTTRRYISTSQDYLVDLSWNQTSYIYLFFVCFFKYLDTFMENLGGV